MDLRPFAFAMPTPPRRHATSIERPVLGGNELLAKSAVRSHMNDQSSSRHRTFNEAARNFSIESVSQQRSTPRTTAFLEYLTATGSSVLTFSAISPTISVRLRLCEDPFSGPHQPQSAICQQQIQCRTPDRTSNTLRTPCCRYNA